MSVCTLLSGADAVHTPFQEIIKALFRVIFVVGPMPPNKGFELREELFDGI
jgi:hypothetical protein